MRASRRVFKGDDGVPEKRAKEEGEERKEAEKKNPNGSGDQVCSVRGSPAAWDGGWGKASSSGVFRSTRTWKFWWFSSSSRKDERNRILDIPSVHKNDP